MTAGGILECDPSPDSFLVLVFFGGSFLVLFVLRRLALLGLQGGEADVPVQGELQADRDEDDEEDGEENGLVIEDGDSLVCGADLRKPVELTHGSGSLEAW